MICRVCKQDKPALREHFPIDRGKLRYECKPCFALIARERRATLTSEQKYAIYLKQRHLHIQFRARHKERLKIENTIRTRFRRQNDLQFRLACNMRRRIHDALKAKGRTKVHKTTDVLGCSFKEFHAYLRSHYTPGMTDDNHGTYWEVDHIIPLSAFNLANPVEMKAAAHHSNIRPLEKSLNRTKGGTNRLPREYYLPAIEEQIKRVAAQLRT